MRGNTHMVKPASFQVPWPTHRWRPEPGAPPAPTATMAEDADMRNELEEMQRRADQLADEVTEPGPGKQARDGRPRSLF